MFLKLSTRILGIAAAAMLIAACSSTKTTDNGGGTGGNDGVTLTDQETWTQQVGDRVFFDLERYDVKPEGMAVLQRQAEFLASKPNYTLVIEGHCDERGTREYNIALGDRRANAVREALISFGVDRARLSTISYGKDKPECGDSNESCWSTNRRGVSVLSGGTGS